jgi:hypothetical protein
MLELLFYASSDESTGFLQDFCEVCKQSSFTVAWSATLEDPVLGGRLIIDMGRFELEQVGGGSQACRPEKAYEGWNRLAVSAHLPLSTPRWRALAALELLRPLLGRHPDIGILDSEDTITNEGVEGPGAFDPIRILRSWEKLAGAFYQYRGAAVLGSQQSEALRTYLSVRPEGKKSHPELCWGEPAVLSRDGAVRIAVLWSQPQLPLALPAVDVVVVPRSDGASLFEVSALRALTDDLKLPGNCQRLSPKGVAPGGPLTGWRLLVDGEWTDITVPNRE